MKVRRLALAGVLIALGVACAPFAVPIGAAKCFPVQHMVNVVGGVMLGPLYNVAIAFCISLIRVLTGTGTLLAFPGSMLGAFVCGWCYKQFGRLWVSYIGEVIGTGILGALAAFPIATLLMGREAALFTYVMPFILSSVVGATVSILVLKTLTKTKVWRDWQIWLQHA